MDMTFMLTTDPWWKSIIWIANHYPGSTIAIICLIIFLIYLIVQTIRTKHL